MKKIRLEIENTYASGNRKGRDRIAELLEQETLNPLKDYIDEELIEELKKRGLWIS